jgi:hypothetical protein
VTVAAIQRGHPEELLTAALVLGAALAAIRARSIWAGILLGLALGTKQWALLAAAPILIACHPGQRLRAALVAGLLAAVLIAPLAVGDPERFTTNNRMAQGGWYHASRFSVWWPLGSEQRVGGDPAGKGSFTIRRLPAHWTTFARPLVVLLSVALSLAFWRRRRVPEDTLALLALILLLRCLLDPTNNDYYHAPFLVALVAWEGVRVRGLPVLSLLAAAALWATISSPWLSPQALGAHFYAVNNAFYLTCGLLLAGWLGFFLFGRRSSVPGREARARDARSSGLTRTWLREPQSLAP